MIFYLYSTDKNRDDDIPPIIHAPPSSYHQPIHQRLIQTPQIHAINYVTEGLMDLFETESLNGVYLFFDIDDTLCATVRGQYIVPKEYINFNAQTKTLCKKGATIFVITKGLPRAELLDKIGCYRSDILNDIPDDHIETILHNHDHLFPAIHITPEIVHTSGILSIQHPHDKNLWHPMRKIDYIQSLTHQISHTLNKPIQEIRLFDNTLLEHLTILPQQQPKPLLQIKQFHVTWANLLSKNSAECPCLSLCELSQLRSNLQKDSY